MISMHIFLNPTAAVSTNILFVSSHFNVHLAARPHTTLVQGLQSSLKFSAMSNSPLWVTMVTQELRKKLVSNGSGVCLQDHKAVGEGDTGPNTGGMGAYSPAPAMTPQIERQVLVKTLYSQVWLAESLLLSTSTGGKSLLSWKKPQYIPFHD